MRFRFIGTYTGGRTSITYGKTTFDGHDWATVTDPDLKRRLDNNPEFESDVDGDNEPDLSVDELHAALDEKGIKYHHKAGAPKLKALLDEAGG